MTDPDRPRETVRDTERTTTVVQTDGGRGGGGMIVAVILILVLLAVLYFLFSGGFNRAADKVGVNVNVETPKVEVPDIKVPDKIEVKVPEVDVKSDGQGNKTQ
jgi:preprotein translocase subunit SecF